jgi:hypothetical protein
MMKRNLTYILLLFSFAGLAQANENVCREYSALRINAKINGIKYKKEGRGFYVLLQDTCTFSNRFDARVYYDTSPFSDTILPAFIVDTFLAAQVDSFFKAEFSRVHTIQDEYGNVTALNRRSWQRFNKHVRLMIGVQGPSDSMIVVQPLKRKLYRADSSYNRQMNLIVGGPSPYYFLIRKKNGIFSFRALGKTRYFP